MAIDPTSNVRIGNYSIGNPQSGLSKKSEEKASENNTQTTNEPALAQANSKAFEKEAEATSIYGRMLIKSHNAQPQENLSWDALVEKAANNLGQTRVEDIDAAMAEFDSGVEMVAQTIDAEFPGMFTPASLNAFAAEVYAAE